MKFFGIEFNDLFHTNDLFTDDLRKSSFTKNPTIIPDIDLVYVLSGRSSALCADVDGLKRECDLEDDITRLREGVRIATQINALRAHKTIDQLAAEDYITPIFYNGRALHNQHLREALEFRILPYPEALFIIKPINPDNTIGQIHSFANYLSTHHHAHVAVVSSAYHLPRVARAIGLDSPQVTSDNWVDHPLSKIKLYLFGVHKNEKRPGIKDDLLGEHNAMQRYSSPPTPSIARHQSNNVFLNDGDIHIYKSFKRALFWGNRITPKPYENSENQLALVPFNL